MTTDEISVFNVAEANQRLPLVRRIVRDIVDLSQDIKERKDRLERLTSRSDDTLYSEEVQDMESAVQRDSVRLSEFVEELERLGVKLQEPEIGHVDFPSLMDGKEVCLCWKYDEAEILWWHASGSGLEGRKSLLETVSEDEN